MTQVESHHSPLTISIPMNTGRRRFLGRFFGSSLSICVQLAIAGIASILCYSAITHLRNPYSLVNAIYRYDMVPGRAPEMLAAVLPFVQIAISIWLISGHMQEAAFRAAFLLFAMYSTAQIVAYARDLNVDCGCFGPSESSTPIGPASIGLPVGLALACLLGSLILKRNR